jgi:hypothetical protein
MSARGATPGSIDVSGTADSVTDEAGRFTLTDVPTGRVQIYGVIREVVRDKTSPNGWTTLQAVRTVAGGPTVDVGDLPPASTDVPADPPVVAPEAPVTATGPGTPVAAVAPTKDTAHNVALALLVLLGLLLLATNSGQLQRSPRLLGGAARHADAAGTAAAPVAAAVPVAVYGTRGLGRFSKPRNGPPRPLI